MTGHHSCDTGTKIHKRHKPRCARRAGRGRSEPIVGTLTPGKSSRCDNKKAQPMAEGFFFFWRLDRAAGCAKVCCQFDDRAAPGVGASVDRQMNAL